MPTRLDLDRLEEELVALAATDAAAAMAAYKAHYTSMAAAYVREYEARPAGVFVLTVGAQPDSVTLSLLATPAQNVYFLHTDESGGNADRAAEVAGLTAQVHKRHVGKVDPLSIYQTVSQILSAHPGADVVLDMTSGAKPMTAALAAAAGYLQGPDARLVLRYVDSDSVKGMFFHRRVLDLEHPVVALGEHERRAAVSAYAAGRYTQAADFFSHLGARKVPGANWAARASLSQAYAALGILDFKGAERHLGTALERLDAVSAALCPGEPLYARAGSLRELHRLCSLLQQAVAPRSKTDASAVFDAVHTSVLVRYLRARARRALLIDPALAALLFYRVVEMASQRRLATHGLDSSNFQPENPEVLLEAYNALVSETQRLSAFEQTIPLVGGLTVLLALGDGCMSQERAAEIKRAGVVRNLSLYAHGFERRRSQSIQTLARVACDFARDVCAADGLPLPSGDEDPAFDPVPLR